MLDVRIPFLHCNNMEYISCVVRDHLIGPLLYLGTTSALPFYIVRLLPSYCNQLWARRQCHCFNCVCWATIAPLCCLHACMLSVFNHIGRWLCKVFKCYHQTCISETLWKLNHASHILWTLQTKRDSLIKTIHALLTFRTYSNIYVDTVNYDMSSSNRTVN